MAYNQYDLANTSLVKTGNLTEMYIPLWYYSSNSCATSDITAGDAFVAKGTTNVVASTSSSAQLHTLNPNWSVSQKFALEVSFFASGAYSSYVQLYDITSGGKTAVTGSQLTTSNTTATVFRSGQFTLTPGHTYGISLWSNSTNSVTVRITKASLIAFLQ